MNTDVVVVALGLANEGLPWATDARDVEKLCASFLAGLRAVADAAKGAARAAYTDPPALAAVGAEIANLRQRRGAARCS